MKGLREISDFFDLLKENIPQFLIGHVVSRVDDTRYNVILSKGHRRGSDKNFDEYVVEAIALSPSIQTNRGVFIELKPGERVLLLYTNSAYFILGSLKKEEQFFKRIDNVKFTNGKNENRSFVIKPNAQTEIVINENDEFVIRTSNQKLVVSPTEEKVEIKTRKGIIFTLDDKNGKISVKFTNGPSIDITSQDEILLKSKSNYGIKIKSDKIEIRGKRVDFYNTPFK